MATFPPFKRHILTELDDLWASHRLRAPFLDVGCGQGDVSEHLAMKGHVGLAIDDSAYACDIARRRLAALPGVKVLQTDLAELPGDPPYATLLLLDVLEHVEDDRGLLAAASRVQAPGDAMILSVPTNPQREWRWDDEFYGHVRRYEPEELAPLLAEAGYEIAEIWELTFPFLWSLRRLYTRFKRPTTPEASSRQELSEACCDKEAWDLGLASRLLSWHLPWRPVLAMQRKLRRHYRLGHEVMILARRVDGAPPTLSETRGPGHPSGARA